MFLSCLDVTRLGALVAPAKQDHELIADLSKVHAKPWPVVDLELRNALADGFAVAEIAELHPVDAGLDLGLGTLVFQSVEP